MMKKYAPVVLLVLLSQLCFAQTYLEEVNGRPIKGSAQADVTGSPYLFKNYKQATVLLKNGKSVSNVPINVDLVNQTPLFIGPGNQVLAFVDPIKSFSVIDTLSDGMIRQVYNLMGDGGYYLVIAEGKLSLLKKMWKVVWEDKTYNSATVNRSILEKSAYYLMNRDGNTLTVTKPSKKSILTTFKDKMPEVEAYLKENKVEFSSDEDLKKLFLYYNSL